MPGSRSMHSVRWPNHIDRPGAPDSWIRRLTALGGDRLTDLLAGAHWGLATDRPADLAPGGDLPEPADPWGPMPCRLTWRWMGVSQWSRTFEGKQLVVDTLFGGARETLSPSSGVEVHYIHSDGDFVVIEHSGRNELADGRRYDNNYCWVFRFQDGLIQEVREYMDTQLVTETFGPDGSS
jgi:ketosteroid isomerase-like protein